MSFNMEINDSRSADGKSGSAQSRDDRKRVMAALLSRIDLLLNNSCESKSVRDLAEAYAFLAAVGQRDFARHGVG